MPVFHILDRERHRPFHAVEVVIETGPGKHYHRGCDAQQRQLGAQVGLEHIFYGLDGLFRVFYAAEQVFVVFWVIYQHNTVTFPGNKYTKNFTN